MKTYMYYIYVQHVRSSGFYILIGSVRWLHGVLKGGEEKAYNARQLRQKNKMVMRNVYKT